MKKFDCKFKEIDQFGDRVSFMVNGSDSLRSNTGATMSLIVALIVLIYAEIKFEALWFYSDTSHQMKTEFGKISSDEIFTFDQTNLNVALSFSPKDWVTLQSKDVKLDEYLTFHAFTLEWQYNPSINGVETWSKDIMMRSCID